MLFQLLYSLDVASPFTVLNWLLAFAVGVLLLDAFLQMEIPSIVAVALIADYLLSFFGGILPFHWRVALFVVFEMLAIAFFYLLWKNVVFKFISAFFLRGAARESIHTAAGKVGIFRKIGEKNFVEWNGELWDANTKDDLRDGERVLIHQQERGVFDVASMQCSGSKPEEGNKLC